MNKNAIKSYAVWARTELIKQVSQKAYEYGVTENSLPELNMDTINGRLLSSNEKSQLNELVREVRKNGFEHVIEEVAYTWFNRFIALRYMEVNNYLPRDLRVRVFTNENNEFKPEILSEALHLQMNGLDTQKVFDYIEQNKQEELYKYLLLTLCNEMNEYLPYMFTSINDYKTLLFPDNLLKDDSVLARLISDIDEDSWLDQVQIIGWLYQYYNTELNELVYNGSMAKGRITKGLVPAATTIYTPDWVVHYMVENSLGKLWIEGHPNFEKEQWKYYLPEAKQDAEVLKELEKVELEHSKLQPEDIKLIDPCMGSGHILVYAFDVLMDIYRDAGYSDRDASKSILENNLYGLEIDERAYHLAYFALMMKARQYNRRILSRDTNINLVEIVESSPELNEDLLWRLGEYKELGQYLVETFKEAKEFGSILNLDCTLEQLNELDNTLIEIDKMADYGTLLDQIESQQLIDIIDPLLKQAKLLVQKYDVVVTNPPYLNASRFSTVLNNYVVKNYKEVKADLCMVMYKKWLMNLKKDKYIAFITTTSWMFLSSFEKFRDYLLSNFDITSLVDFGSELFDGKVGHNLIVSWIVKNKQESFNGTYIRLVDYCYSKRDLKQKEYFNMQNYYVSNNENFKKIPGSPIAYWISDKAIEFCKTYILSNDVVGSVGIQTGDNEKFIRLWTEVNFSNIKFASKNVNDSFCNEKWFPYNKGGDYRKWYGNNYFIVNWQNDGEFLKKDNKITGHHYQEYKNELKFSPCITWSRITSGNPSFRIKRNGFLNDMAGFSVFSNSLNLNLLLGFCNSIVSKFYLSFLAPTINIMIGNVLSLPYNSLIQNKCDAEFLVKKCILLSKEDWDSFETSWDFKTHPLVELRLAGASAWGDNTPSARISSAYKTWSMVCEERFNELKSNEEELNRIFIDIYGLQDELTPEIEDKDVTVRKADLVRDIKSFISYAVGCMFGRYSLDVEGLAYAGGEWDDSKYTTFVPDKDDIIPICDEEYFEDDIVSRFIEFVSVVYGSDTLEENLKFIADALGGKGTPREVLRNYFLNDFFKDHCNTYQVTGSGKRPIYWLFDSGKKNGFKALVYIHRYTPDLIARMRTGYIHPQQARYRTQIELLQEQIDMAGSTSEKVKLSKQLKKINEQLSELNKYEEIVHHWADKMEPMDLDDGVKVNYAKFQELLAKIK